MPTPTPAQQQQPTPTPTPTALQQQEAEAAAAAALQPQQQQQQQQQQQPNYSNSTTECATRLSSASARTVKKHLGKLKRKDADETGEAVPLCQAALTEDTCADVGCCFWDSGWHGDSRFGSPCHSAVGDNSCEDGNQPEMCTQTGRQEIFSEVDADSNGVVTEAQLAAVLGPDEAAAVMADADTNVDGKMDYAEFNTFATCNFCPSLGAVCIPSHAAAQGSTVSAQLAKKYLNRNRKGFQTNESDTGVAMCEGDEEHGWLNYNEGQCTDVGCCQWGAQTCTSAVGSGKCKLSTSNPEGFLIGVSWCEHADRQAVFDMVDDNGNGFASEAELASVLGPDEAAAVMADADTNGDGKMSYAEFSTFVICNFCEK